MPNKPNFYAGGVLDRVSAQRKDQSWIDAMFAAAETRIVPIWRAQNFVAGGADLPQAGLLSAADLPEGAEYVLLGLRDGTAYFAADLSHVEDPAVHPGLSERGSFADLRSFGPLMAPEEGNILAYARGLTWWHARHRFCGVCGHPTVSAEGGHVRRCTNPDCATPHFPRTDPAVIMLVHDGDRCLLGRQSRFPPGMYSTLAGFVEPGESLEEAVAREVLEETGIRVGEVTYHSSQPWPFPSSLMLGFHAEAVSRDISIEQDELEDAGWFSRDEILTTWGEGGTHRLPRPDSISRRLIEDWLHG
ncbi:NAD(+) diphosphatase [Skermanella mucosa]|uniref:NAD(+) diphosphatase n=1 Tax=Skermanella mucosa TaxID=1789672 RepID=UPI00192BB2D3|nr:NAD(+) diphosphatase [Skermanella mucosa]UEM20289.1 NAD(+) diphosphatase [Skermanella mucosa]